jgi:hypothetical protein
LWEDERESARYVYKLTLGRELPNKCVSAAQHTQCQDSHEQSTAITPVVGQPQSINHLCSQSKTRVVGTVLW